MFNAPFIIVLFGFLGCIIFDLSVICKKLFPLCLHYRPTDLPQAHFRDVAGGDTQGIDGGWGVEVINGLEIFGQQEGVCGEG